MAPFPGLGSALCRKGKVGRAQATSPCFLVTAAEWPAPSRWCHHSFQHDRLVHPGTEPKKLSGFCLDTSSQRQKHSKDLYLTPDDLILLLLEMQSPPQPGSKPITTVTTAIGPWADRDPVSLNLDKSNFESLAWNVERGNCCHKLPTN